MFEIEFDEKEGLLKRRLWGFWTLDTVHDYVSELGLLVARIRRTHPDFRTLSDSTQMLTQSIEVSAALSETMKTMCMTNPGRVAIVARDVLGKLQIERIYPYPTVRAFLNEESARAWLFEDVSQLAP